MSEPTDADDGNAAEGVEEVEEEIDTSHLDGIQDGCGCTEIWEHLSESREAAAADAAE